MNNNRQAAPTLTLVPPNPTVAFYAFLKAQGEKAAAEQRRMNAGKSLYQLVTGGGQSLPG